MIIERHDIDIGIPFKELKEGSVFLYDDIAYIKTQSILDHRFNVDCNAIRLDDGCLGTFDNVDMVCPRPNARLLIK